MEATRALLIHAIVLSAEADEAVQLRQTSVEMVAAALWCAGRLAPEGAQRFADLALEDSARALKLERRIRAILR